MAKKKRVSFVARIGHAVSDVANAASVAATGSEIGILELAAEEEMRSPETQRSRRVVRKKRKAKVALKKTAKKKMKKKVAPKRAKKSRKQSKKKKRKATRR